MKVFLNHAPPDQEVARELASELERAGHEVWDPYRELFPGDNWPLEIGRALRDSNAMVVILSPDAARSEQMQQAVGFAIGARQYAGRLVTLVVRDTKIAPWILNRLPLVRVNGDRTEAIRQVVDHLATSRE